MGRSLLLLAALGAAAFLTYPRGRDQGACLRGWPWLGAGLVLQVAWVQLLSQANATPALLRWMPALALLPALRFLWLNRGYRGLWVVAAGAGLNLLVMACNGGLMPIAPGKLHAQPIPAARAGTALALSKDRVLDDASAHLALLDDRLVLVVAGLHIACSLGDILVAGGCLATMSEEARRALEVARRAVDAVPGNT